MLTINSSKLAGAALLMCLPLLLAPWPARSADPPKANSPVISELRAARLELLLYKEQVAKATLEKIGTDQRAAYTAICTEAGLTAPDFAALIEVCGVDLEKRLVTRLEKKK